MLIFFWQQGTQPSPVVNPYDVPPHDGADYAVRWGSVDWGKKRKKKIQRVVYRITRLAKEKPLPPPDMGEAFDSSVQDLLAEASREESLRLDSQLRDFLLDQLRRIEQERLLAAIQKEAIEARLLAKALEEKRVARRRREEEDLIFAFMQDFV